MDYTRRVLAVEHLARVIPALDPKAWERIAVHAPEWTDHNESDPGVTLVELLAFVAETLLYRSTEPSAFPHTVQDAGPLGGLLAVIAREIASIHDEMEKLYGSQFVGTGDPPATAALRDISFPGIFVEEVSAGMHQIPGVPTSNRIEGVRIPRPGKEWVKKFDAPDLDATPNDVPIEPIELNPDGSLDTDDDD